VSNLSGVFQITLPCDKNDALNLNPETQSIHVTIELETIKRTEMEQKKTIIKLPLD
jgi:hypothetical protein